MKRLVSLMLVLAMAFSLAVPAYAVTTKGPQDGIGVEDGAVYLNWNTYAMAASYDNANGETIVLKAKYDAAAYEAPRLEWASGDASIVSLKSQTANQITMQAHTVGWTDITVSFYDGETLIDTDVCSVSVVDNYDRTTFLSLDLSADKLTLKAGDAYTELTPIFYPVDFLKLNRPYFAELEVVSGYDTGVITVALSDGKVRVTPVAAGTTTFTVRSKANLRAATCTVTVVGDDLAVTGLTPSTTEVINLLEGETAQLSATGATDLIWTSSNAYIASVDQSGLVTGRSTSNYKERWNKVANNSSPRSTNPATESDYDDWQTVTITATSVQGGFTANFQVMVAPKPVVVTSIAINRDTEAVAIGGVDKFLTAAVNPATVLSPDVVWTSDDESVLRVETVADTIFGAPQAKLIPVAAGTAIVTAAYANLTDTCVVTVTDGAVKISKIGLQKSADIVVDEVAQLTTSITSTAENQKIFWLSTNRAAVTVNNEGIIQGYSAFEEADTLSATIYAFAIDSLTEAQKKELYFSFEANKKGNQQIPANELGEIRNISASLADTARLQAILDEPNVVWESCKVTVSNPSIYLRNLHIPAEAITSSSVALLWNRASLYYASALTHSEVYVSGEQVAVLGDEMGYTVKGLQADTVYTFKVTTYYGEGESVSETITAMTKPAATVVLNVLDAPFNAAGDGKTTDTFAIQAAIDACPAGGEVWLPAGHVFFSGALFLKSDMTFRVDGILYGSADPKDYPRMVTRWEGWRKIYQPRAEWLSGATAMQYPDGADYPTFTPGNNDNQYSHSSLITLGVYDEGENAYTGPFNIENVVICGDGQINANGYQLGFNEGPNNAATGGQNGTSPKNNATIRGRAISMHNAKNVYLADVLVANSPGWQIQIIYSKDITVDHIASIANGNAATKVGSNRHYILNGDGTNADSSILVNIVNAYYRAGDDAIAAKSGKDFEGKMLNKPTAYLRASDIFGDNSRYGFIIGSEMAGGAHDCLFLNSEFTKAESDSTMWIKAPANRGGLIEDILYKDVYNNNTNRPAINAAASYSAGDSNVPSPVTTVIRRIVYENIYEPTNNSATSNVIGNTDTKWGTPNVPVDITDVLLVGSTLAKAINLARTRKLLFIDWMPGYTVTTQNQATVSDITELKTATPTAIEWIGLTANGVSNEEDTTQLTLTFSGNPVTLSERNITVTGATKGVLTGTGSTRILTLTDIAVDNGEEIQVEISSQPIGYAIAGEPKTVEAAVEFVPASVSIRAPETTMEGSPVEYTVSMANAKGVMNATILFEVDGAMLAGRDLQMLNEFFTALDFEEGTPSTIRWTPKEDGMWQGEVVLLYLAGAEGFTAKAEQDLFKAIYDAKQFGDASMKLTGVRLAGLDEEGLGIFLEGGIGVAEASSTYLKYYSPYDLNRDGVIDERDLAMAQRYYQVREGDANWAAASVCDFSGNGVVDMPDLIELFIHFTR